MAKIVGTSRNEQLVGSAFNDLMSGNAGNDTLFGEAGSDRLDGGAGRDVLNGGRGNDTLAGGNGRDDLYGGSGSDVFIFSDGEADDVIGDFEVGNDTISIFSGSVDSFNELKITGYYNETTHVTVISWNSEIPGDPIETITLTGVDYKTISKDDFSFVMA